ncbi:MAG: CoA ester lyase [Rhodospirillaceae bacterium]
MASQVRPRRSVLYMPGSNARALEKGRGLAADALILDMEDAVAPDAKQTARDLINAAIAEGGYGMRELTVRVNGLDSPWGKDDLNVAAKMGAHAVVVPKVESKQMVLDVIKALDAAGGPKHLPIWAMMETPMGMLHAEEIAFAHPRLQCLVMGTSDLAKDLRATHTPDRIPFMTSLGLCLLAARAAGIAILDGVHLDLADDEGFKAHCVQGKELGMDGKTLIHPKTIDMANQVFSPSDDEVAWSKCIIKAHAEAEKAGKGVVLVDGKLIENLHVEGAKRLVAMAEAIAGMEAANATAAE